MYFSVLLLFYKCNCLETEHVCAFKYDYTYDEEPNYPLGSGDLPMLNRKIFLGTRVSILEHPYVVSIRRLSAHYLTGVIVSRNLVLTVAHPINGVPINELGVVAGENYSDRGSRIETIILIVIHPDFDMYTLTGDLAILRTYEKFFYRVSIKPVRRMLNKSFRLDKERVTGFLTGWGRCDTTSKTLCLPRSTKYHPDEIQDPMLRSISFDITEKSVYCEAYDKRDVHIGPGMLCLGRSRLENHATPCLAVPGAPLVVHGWLLGILSWGFGCGYHGDLPLVYTDVRFYKEWILQVINMVIRVREGNFTSLFEATRAAILNEYLTETRVKINRNNHYDLEIQPWDMDRHLAQIDGNVYDIRDYMYESKYKNEKSKMYRVIKAMMKRQEVTDPIENISTTKKVREVTEDFHFIDDENSKINTKIPFNPIDGTTKTTTETEVNETEEPEEDIP